MKIQVAVGRCPVCGTVREACDGLLEHYKCARGHEPVRYVLADAYYQEAKETWID